MLDCRSGARFSTGRLRHSASRRTSTHRACRSGPPSSGHAECRRAQHAPVRHPRQRLASLAGDVRGSVVRDEMHAPRAAVRPQQLRQRPTKCTPSFRSRQRPRIAPSQTSSAVRKVTVPWRSYSNSAGAAARAPRLLVDADDDLAPAVQPLDALVTPEHPRGRGGEVLIEGRHLPVARPVGCRLAARRRRATVV
jgi:hypothetical protein